MRLLVALGNEKDLSLTPLRKKYVLLPLTSGMLAGGVHRVHVHPQFFGSVKEKYSLYLHLV